MAAMPKKTDPRVVIRLSPEDHAELLEAAAGEPLATYMRNAALGIRQRDREAAEAVQSGAQVRVEMGSIVPEQEPLTFKCRVHDCDFTARSSKAHCRWHPGTLVPA